MLPVSDESEELVAEYIDKMGLSLPIAAGFQGEPWGVTGYPSAALIDAEGVISWTGHPSELSSSKIKDALKGVKPTKGGFLAYNPGRELDSKLKSAVQSAADGSLGKAISAATRVAADEKVDPAVRAEAEAFATELLDFAQLVRGQAEVFIQDRAVLPGVEALEALAKELKGTELGDEVAARLKEIAADDGLQTEIDAAEAYESALAAIEKRGLKKAVKKLESIVKKYPDTRAAARAEALLRRG